MTAIACYISGHGFGHATRSIEVLRALRTRQPDLELIVRTPLGREFFEFNLGGAFAHGTCQLDVGAVQSDSLTVDPEASLRAYAAIAANAPALIESELAALAERRPALVFADIPGLAFDVAARLGVPGIGMANFSWDWIYADYAREFPQYGYVVDHLRGSYGRSDLLLRLPMYGDLSAFPHRRDLRLVARHATATRLQTRGALALSPKDRLVLLSFGGMGLALAQAPAPPPGVGFVTTDAVLGDRPSPASCRVVSNRDLAQAGLRYEDLVAACDAVMTKPGYGIVAECIANATPMIYTSRGSFAEYPCLVAGIEAHLPNAFISNDDLYGGRWNEALEAIFAQPRRVPKIATDGAAQAAEVLIELLV